MATAAGWGLEALGAETAGLSCALKAGAVKSNIVVCKASNPKRVFFGLPGE
ncbi:MAG: hypothetical protein ABSA83_22195 [Verrucomicrobiota bacterium]